MQSLLQTVLLVFSLALYAQQTYVPDDNFEQALIDLGYDDVLDDYVLTANINTITELNIGNNEIAVLTGIEGFTSLEELICDNNNITALDMSSNLLLKHLECQYNQLNTLNIESCVNIEYLNCNVNNLTVINISNCINLYTLLCSSNNLSLIDINNNSLISEIRCSSNNLSSIDISFNDQLFTLYCGNNFINNIDVSNNINLNNLNVSWNEISSLDLSNNTNLHALDCQNNLLTEIDVSANPLLVFVCSGNELTQIDIRNNYNDNMLNFDATNNPNLHCVFVDDTDFLNPNNWHVDDNSIFMESESECDLAIENEILNNTTIFPNPTKDILLFENIDDPISGVIKIYNFLGELVLTKDMIDNKLDISSLGNGTYFLSIETKKGMINRKIIKY